MDPVVGSLANSLDLQGSLVRRAIARLTEEDAWRRPATASNSVGWLLGHIAWSRNHLVAALGGEPEPLPWAGLFERGASAPEPSACPDTATLVAALDRIDEKLKARMATVTDAELSAPSKRATPFPDKTVRGTAAFLVFHDAYHTGQVGYAMKLLGQQGLVG